MASGFCDWKLSLNSDFMGPSPQIPQLSRYLHENFICHSSQTLRFLFYSSETSALWSVLQISRLNGSYPRYLEGQTSLSDQLIPHNVKCTVYSDFSVTLSMLDLSQWPAHPSVDQTLRLFCLFCHICLWFEAKNPIILSAFPVMPPPAFTPSLIRSNPPDYTVSLCHIIYLQYKTANHPHLHTPLSLLPGRSSHPSLANMKHSSSPGVGGPTV